jgi:hypothetical protein
MSSEDRSENELMNQKVRCVNLLLDCPLNRKAPGCPFASTRREESVVTRVNWLKSLDLARIKDLLARHERCLSQPTGKVIQ